MISFMASSEIRQSREDKFKILNMWVFMYVFVGYDNQSVNQTKKRRELREVRTREIKSMC